MKFELGDIVPILNDKYMVVETVTYMDINYILANKLDETEEPLEEFYIYKTNEFGVVLVTDKELLDVLLPVFSNKLERDINNLNIEEKYNI